MKKVMTVRGAISPDELGHTQMHDHLFIDLSGARHRWLAMPITDEVSKQVALTRVGRSWLRRRGMP